MQKRLPDFLIWRPSHFFVPIPLLGEKSNERRRIKGKVVDARHTRTRAHICVPYTDARGVFLGDTKITANFPIKNVSLDLKNFLELHKNYWNRSQAFCFKISDFAVIRFKFLGFIKEKPDKRNCQYEFCRANKDFFSFEKNGTAVEIHDLRLQAKKRKIHYLRKSPAEDTKKKISYASKNPGVTMGLSISRFLVKF